MIAFLSGTLEEKSASGAVIDVQGVGYRVTLSTLSVLKLPPVGQTVRVRTHLVVRDDAFELFGFLNAEEEHLFRLLTSVSGVGPKTALALLSGLEGDAVVDALARGDVARLKGVHGVGKKTAERLVLELKEKVAALALSSGRPRRSVASGGVRADVVSALVNLQYRDAQAEAAADAALEKVGPEPAFEALFREALRGLKAQS